MSSMTESAAVQRINAQLSERYQQISTGIVYRVVMECAGMCELESIDRGTNYRSREQLNNPENWRRMP